MSLYNDDSLSMAKDINGEMINIDNADKKNEYFCPDAKCNSKVIPVHGQSNRWHYRHEVYAGCNGGMTALHRHAEEIIVTMDSFLMPAHKYRNFKVFDSAAIRYTNPIREPNKEQRNGINYRPDVIADLSDGRKLWIEVTVTSRTEGEKLQFLKDNGIIAIELDLSCVDRMSTTEQLTKIIHNAGKRRPSILKYLSFTDFHIKNKVIDDKIKANQEEQDRLALIKKHKKAGTLTEGQKLRQHEYQQLIKNGTISDKQARHNHNEWVKRAKASRIPFLTYERFLAADFLNGEI